MKTLNDIKDYVQAIAETIESVIGVDVTIVDIYNTRVAATGEYKSKIGDKVNEKSVFTKSMNENKNFIVIDPRNEDVCIECNNKTVCSEYAEVCSPIILDSKAIGVIGLIAFCNYQKEAIKNNQNNLLEFLRRMGDLLTSKLLEESRIEKERIMLTQIETIINSIDDGVVAIDNCKRILYINKNIEKLFGANTYKNAVEGLLERINIDKVLLQNKKIKNLQMEIFNTRVVIDATPIEFEGKVIGSALVVRSLRNVNKIINDITILNIKTVFDDIVGISREIIETKEKSICAAKGDSTVLILGESGTGKEMFARAIHSNSKRGEKPFIAINCAAIPESLLESELFGYEEGAFTGARKGGKIGKFEIANGGTVFLDEIGDMSLHLQTKLLRVLQERVIEKVGSFASFPIDIRIIAATHKDLGQMVKQEEFRRDLFYRLNVIPITIPPLRDRSGDIKVLSDYLLAKCNTKLNKDIKGFEKGIYNIFNSYAWPGNVRELENVIEYAVNMEKRDYIEAESLPIRFKDEKCETGSLNLRDLERAAIERAVLKYKNRDLAAEALGIGRATLFRKIKEYGIKNLE
jgi:transcriptional regulator with PAS, ATPase and Fis domain